MEVAGSHTSDDDTDCTASVRYRYSVDDKSYESDRIYFGGQPDTTRMLAEQIVAKYPVGGKVEVLYDPKHPKNAALEGRSATAPAIYAMLVVFTAISAVLVAHSIAGKVLTTAGGVPLFAFLGPLAAIAIAIAAIGLFFKMRRETKSSAQWPTVTGKITVSEVAEEIKTDDDVKYRTRQDIRYRIKIQFSYRVGSRDYYSSKRKWGWDEIYPDRDAPAAIVAKFPVGSTVPVYYDPADPQSAVLEPSNRGGAAAPLLAAALFGLPGISFLWFLISVA